MLGRKCAGWRRLLYSQGRGFSSINDVAEQEFRGQERAREVSKSLGEDIRVDV